MNMKTKNSISVIGLFQGIDNCHSVSLNRLEVNMNEKLKAIKKKNVEERRSNIERKWVMDKTAWLIQYRDFSAVIKEQHSISFAKK